MYKTGGFEQAKRKLPTIKEDKSFRSVFGNKYWYGKVLFHKYSL